jgi:hypothetical protein
MTVRQNAKESKTNTSASMGATKCMNTISMMHVTKIYQQKRKTPT